MAKFKTLDEAQKYILANKRIRIVGNTAGHGFPVGAVVKITKVTKGSTGLNVMDDRAYQYTVYLTDIESAVMTKTEINEIVSGLKEQIDSWQAKLDYLKSSGAQELNETEFKVWNTLQLLKGKKNDLEKAKAIASLINS